MPMTEVVGGDLFPIIRAFSSLGLVLAIVLAFGWLLRRRMAGGRAGRMHVEERLVIARNQQVLLLRVGARRLLVGAGERGLSLLTELDPADDSATCAPEDEPAVADDETLLSAATRFRGALGDALRARRSAP